MKTYKLINTFHNTEVSFLAKENIDGAYAAYTELCYNEFSKHKDSEEYQSAHRKLMRIKKVLCGSSECQCGGMIEGVAQ